MSGAVDIGGARLSVADRPHWGLYAGVGWIQHGCEKTDRKQSDL